MSKTSGSRIALYVILAIVAIILLGGIILTAFVYRFLKSPEGKGFTSTIGKLSEIEMAAPQLIDATERYVNEKGDFPNSIDDLADYLPPKVVEVAKTSFTYTKPSKDDPPDTIIFTTADMPMLMGAVVRIEITKDLNARQVQTMPLEGVRRRQSPPKGTIQL